MFQNKQTEEITLLNGQLIASFLFLINLGISILLLYNQKLNVLEEETIFDEQTARDIALWNKVFAIILLFYFLYVSYIVYQEATEEDEKKDAGIQLLSSTIVIVAAFLGLYVILKNYNGELPFINIENPEI